MCRILIVHSAKRFQAFLHASKYDNRDNDNNDDYDDNDNDDDNNDNDNDNNNDNDDERRDDSAASVRNDLRAGAVVDADDNEYRDSDLVRNIEAV